MGAVGATAAGSEAATASAMVEAAATASGAGAPGATATAHCSDVRQLPPSGSCYPGHTTMDTVQLQQDQESELNNEYNSQTDLSQKELVEDIKNWLEKSVERRIKRRTTNKRKRKEKVNLVDEEEGYDDDTKAYNRYSVPYVYLVLQSITSSEHRKGLVKQMGFEDMLELDDCNVPRLFAQWIIDNTKPEEGVIRIGENSIPTNPESFQDVLGIPAGDLPVETDEMIGKASFLELFGLSEIPSIRYFGDKIINEENLLDAEFCHCFMSIILGAFLCPNSSTKPSTKYLGALVDVDKIKDRNWAKFAYDWFIWYVTKYLKERSKQTKGTITLGGCIYHTAVRYLHFIEFGSIKLPPTLPRIRVWK
uniref:Uncharacterized protein n=1 Tax=Avena sativa TaxID=4498 RepID=A0ACD5Z7G1_AVESA